MYSSACKAVQTTQKVYGNVDILYLLSHVDSVSLCTGRVSSKYVAEYSYPNFQAPDVLVILNDGYCTLHKMCCVKNFYFQVQVQVKSFSHVLT